MAKLKRGRNAWWDQMSREEQEEYLDSHPRSRLQITKRRKRVKTQPDDTLTKVPDMDKDDAEAPQASGESESETPAADSNSDGGVDLPSEHEPEIEANDEQLEEIKQAGQPENQTELSPSEQKEAEHTVAQTVAPQMTPEKAAEALSDDDKDEMEEDLEDAVDEEDPPKRKQKFAKVALRLAIRTGLITAGVLLTGAVDPTMIFLPQVYGSIWDKSDTMSRASSDYLGTALKVLHKHLKRGARGFVTHGARPKKAA